MKHTIITIILFLFIQTPTLFGQQDDSLVLRLKGMSIEGQKFLNVDGVDITTQTALTNFSHSNFYKKFNKFIKFNISKADINYSDPTLSFKNFCVSKSDSQCVGTTEYLTTYYYESYANQVTAVVFHSFNKRDISLERNLLTLLYTKKIPSNVYNSLELDSLNFVGRHFLVGRNCRWMNQNNMQCPGNGQMDWSIHRTLDDAEKNIANRVKVINCKDNGIIISDELVDVIFEGSKTKARKLIYDFTGVTNVLVGMTGGQTLTIYLVATTVRNYNISCMMSYWNNDYINNTGLPTLLDQVMVLDK